MLSQRPYKRNMVAVRQRAGGILAFVVVPVFLAAFFACGLRSVEVYPKDSDILLNQKSVDAEELLHHAKSGDVITVSREGYHDLTYVVGAEKTRDLRLSLEPRRFELTFNIDPVDSVILIDDTVQTVDFDGTIDVTYGPHIFAFEKQGFETVTRELDITSGVELTIRLLPEGSRHEFLGQASTGIWPKQIIFSPEGNKIFVPLLADTGVEIIDLNTDSLYDYEAERFAVSERYGHIGFVEGIFNRAGNRFFVTQMNTSSLFVVRYPELELERIVPTGGSWPKVVVLSPDEEHLAISNWASDDISIIDAATFGLEELLSFDALTPRGLAFTPDGRYLLAAYYDSGHIVKISTDTWKAETILRTGGANRHIVIDPDSQRAYISNMAYHVVYLYDLTSDRITKTIKVGIHPNTIALTPDYRYLYVSCRGPNNPENYGLPSPEDGEIYMIDTRTLEVVEVIAGGNQPTGLAVSPDGALLVFSNFQDNDVEIYRIKSIDTNGIRD